MAGRNGTTRRKALTWLAAGSLAAPISLSGPGAWGQTSQGVPKQASLPVDLNLVLALDASGSVSWSRFALQKQGYVDAFANKRVLDAIGSGAVGAIGVMMVQWTGPELHADVVGWTRISDETSMRAFSAAIAGAERQLFGGGTSISGAIDYGMLKLGESPFTGGRRVIDISGDGVNNRGRPATDARDAAVALGVNINGLPILEIEPDLDSYYRSNVIGGPGAFVIAAATFKDFGEAILRKLILEISGRQADEAGPRPV